VLLVIARLPAINTNTNNGEELESEKQKIALKEIFNL
jgi:hypothetical protein